jgi:transcriptional regulator with XRE-family HTH domain
MPMNDPVTMRRKLRGELKRLRTAHGLTQRQVAEKLDWSQSKIIRIENGAVAIGVTDLRALLQLYQVEDEATAAELEAMARGSKQLPFASYRDVYTAETLRFFGYVQSASIVRQFEPLLIPGLLQTEEYARAWLGSQDVDPKRIDRIWEAREERQDLLDRPDSPELFFIVDEAAVRRPMGGESVMKRQLERLVERNSQPRVTVQVIPFEVGAHNGLRGPFVHLEFPGIDDPDVLYLESTLGDTIFRDDPEITGEYLADFLGLETRAAQPRDLGRVLGLIDA